MGGDNMYTERQHMICCPDVFNDFHWFLQKINTQTELTFCYKTDSSPLCTRAINLW